MDLRHSLQPGIRVQGITHPFWQQFVYEALEGFCSSCGSLHLEGPCSVSAGSSRADESESPVFGSWLTAVRQRRNVSGSLGELRKKPSSMTNPAAPGFDSVAQMAKEKQRSVATGVDEWRTPIKVARRKVPPSAKMVVVSDATSADAGGEMQKTGMKVPPAIATVPVSLSRAGTVASEKLKFKEGNKFREVEDGSKSNLPISNPFSSSTLGVGCGSEQGSGDAFPGPLKRARPVENLAPRINPKTVKRKGKGKVALPKNIEAARYFPVNPSLLQCSSGVDQEVSQPGTEMNVGLTVVVSDEEIMTRHSVNLAIAADGPKTDSLLMTDGGTPASQCLPDMVMMEDQGGVPASSNN